MLDSLKWALAHYQEILVAVLIIYAAIQKVKAKGSWESLIWVMAQVEKTEKPKRKNPIKVAARQVHIPLVDIAALIVDPKKKMLFKAVPQLIASVRTVFGWVKDLKGGK